VWAECGLGRDLIEPVGGGQALIYAPSAGRHRCGSLSHCWRKPAQLQYLRPLEAGVQTRARGGRQIGRAEGARPAAVDKQTPVCQLLANKAGRPCFARKPSKGAQIRRRRRRCLLAKPIASSRAKIVRGEFVLPPSKLRLGPFIGRQARGGAGQKQAARQAGERVFRLNESKKFALYARTELAQLFGPKSWPIFGLERRCGRAGTRSAGRSNSALTSNLVGWPTGSVYKYLLTTKSSKVSSRLAAAN